MLERVMLSAGSGGSGWLAVNTDAGYKSVAIEADSSKNVYIGSWAVGWSIHTIKYNSNPTVQWRKGLSSTIADAYCQDMTIDSSGNVYTCGFNLYSPGEWFNPEAGQWEPYYSYQMIVAKYNSSGVLQWQRYYQKPPTDPPNNGDERPNRIAVDGSGNVYVAGKFTGRPGIVKFNSSGTLQWQFTMNDGALVAGLAVTSAGDVYASVRWSDQRGWVVAKFNTSGTLQWQRQFSWGVGGILATKALTLDSAENVIVVGNPDGTGDYITAKYNSSGTLQWQKNLSSAGAPTNVCVDASNNIYVIGGTTTQANIVKYNSSGDVQWQRGISTVVVTGNQGGGADIAVDNLGSVYFITKNQSFGYVVFGKLPDTGDGAGSYAVGGITLTYATTTFTNSNSSYTSTTPTFTWSNPSFNSGASSMGDFTSGFAIQVVQI